MTDHSINGLMEEHESTSNQVRDIGQEENTFPFIKPYMSQNCNSGPEYDLHAFSPEILSSSHYPIPEPLNLETTGVSDRPQILYGGLSVYNEDIVGRDDGLATDRLKRPQLRSATKRSRNNIVASDCDSSRKRGRPRMFTKDETVTEVCTIFCFHRQQSNTFPSDVEHRYDLLSGLIGCARKQQYPR